MKTVWFIDEKNQINSGELLQSDKNDYLVGCSFGQKLRRLPEVYGSPAEAQAKLNNTAGKVV